MNALSHKERRRLILVLTMMLIGSPLNERTAAMRRHKAATKARKAASKERRQEAVYDLR